ncbi:hypothetical protein VP01_3820g1 [Puccinia sorghi]|uniref:Uncharacterized protein n=1 Tax=Puccinia sorghi TaxID=27349 RepID=A0A0L6UV53_9BASI|nr:hypothetical protein VP01_3820g1 [Puccinia sorghi]
MKITEVIVSRSESVHLNAVQEILEGFQLSDTTKPEANIFDSQFNEVFNNYTQAVEDPESNERKLGLEKKI